VDACKCHKKLKYQDFVERFVWDRGCAKKGVPAHWKPRKQKSDTIGRLVSLHPSKGGMQFQS
jgi:hypothetical protein